MALSRTLPKHPRRDEGDPFASGTEPLFLADLPTLAGQEGVFDQAVTNGLAAIVASEWPGEESDAKGRVHSARRLLRVIESHLEPGPDGVIVVPDPDRPKAPATDAPPSGLFQADELPPLDTRIDVRTLEDGLDATQPARHASGHGGLRHEHIDALLALDDHPSLRVTPDEQANRDWESAWEEDRHSAARAGAFLERIGDDEAARRAAAVDNPNAYHPKHNPDGHELETCPVCGYDSFCIDGPDLYGRAGYGQCLVCTYMRSPHIADEEGFGEHLTWLMDKDD